VLPPLHPSHPLLSRAPGVSSYKAIRGNPPSIRPAAWKGFSRNLGSQSMSSRKLGEELASSVPSSCYRIWWSVEPDYPWQRGRFLHEKALGIYRELHPNQTVRIAPPYHTHRLRDALGPNRYVAVVGGSIAHFDRNLQHRGHLRRRSHLELTGLAACSQEFSHVPDSSFLYTNCQEEVFS
jgi:hypothetical protein